MSTDQWLLSTSYSQVKEMGNLGKQKTSLSTSCVWITYFFTVAGTSNSTEETVSDIFWDAAHAAGWPHNTTERCRGDPSRGLWVKGAARRLGEHSVWGAPPSVHACPEVSWVLGPVFFRLCGYTHPSHTGPIILRGAQPTRSGSCYLWCWLRTGRYPQESGFEGRFRDSKAKS